jgi:hypothetical protein
MKLKIIDHSTSSLAPLMSIDTIESPAPRLKPGGITMAIEGRRNSAGTAALLGVWVATTA